MTAARSPVKRLTSIATTSLLDVQASLTRDFARSSELLRLLRARNGFYAFESALHVFPAGIDDRVMTLERWNEPSLWRAAYGDLLNSDCVFFAEDLFGNQFGLAREGIVQFDAETSAVESVAPNLDSWIVSLLREHEVITGWPLAHAWQERCGVLQPGQRLVPKQPFVLGGAYEIENLRVAAAVEGMRSRAALARQIADLPDGAQVRITVVE